MARKQSLGRWLAARRAERGKSRAEIAAAVGVTYASIHFWETDHCRPRPENLSAICKVLRASVREAKGLVAA